MNVNLDAAKLPAGFVAVAILLEFAPGFVTTTGLLVLAAGASVATMLKLKGAMAIVGAMVAAVIIANVTGYGSPGLDNLGHRASTSVGQLGGMGR